MNSNHNYGYFIPSTPTHSHISIPSILVKIINDSTYGTLSLIEIMRKLKLMQYPYDSTFIWKILNENRDNFIIDEQSKKSSQLNGKESVWVFTKLTLCDTHCRKGQNGRNQECRRDCGALHLCRTYLLCSQKACPFNNRQNCMFGHKFFSPHNSPLLKMHNLDLLDKNDLRKLFRRPPSRSKTTIPQVCIYYNKVNSTGCSKKKCKSLHLCADFIQRKCPGACSRNHRLSDPQVKNILDLFEIDQSWQDESIFVTLERFYRSRYKASSSDDEASSNASSDHDDLNLSRRIQGAQSVPNLTSVKTFITNDSSDEKEGDSRLPQSSACQGCSQLQKELNQMKTTIFSLSSDVEELKKTINRLIETGNTASELTLSGNPVCKPASYISSLGSHGDVRRSSLEKESWKSRCCFLKFNYSEICFTRKGLTRIIG
ncbi:unnamed protein product [Lymnaea stagnalis]|uniref:PARP12-like CCCH zinc finger tandem domain-containing protein n=1 Tax=Lymnaea stagnalis TaxID=6523 RepID=A0AAV2I319_LYMST